MKLTDLYQAIDDIIIRYGLQDYVIGIKDKSGIGDIEKVIQELEILKKKGKYLRIGIIGRVKAGKSSLLNAILFNGNDVLPKAATPMTAALTVIQYSEVIGAELEFFNKKDLAQIQREHDKYEEELENKINEILERNKKRNARRAARNSNQILVDQSPEQAHVSSDEREKARQIAQAEMQSSIYAASYDQYKRIIATGLQYQELEKFRNISATSIDNLVNGKLQDFVGANGRYMPFTKSVTLKIPEDNLKDLEIIDTPGINDPVQSRGKRTEEMLQSCDVVLIVSPSGQFLSNEDIQLMQRVATREGIQEVYIISSQVDNQLYGNEGEGIHNPKVILNNISRTLTNHAYGVLEKKANDANSNQQLGGESAANVYKKAIENTVICTSGVAYSLWKRFDDKKSWDSNLQHVWEKLSKRFPDYFNEPQTALLTLENLANINAVHHIIDDVKKRKSEIFAIRVEKLESDKWKAMNNYLNGLVQYISREIHDLNKSNIESLKEQQRHLRTQANETEYRVKNTYEDLIDILGMQLKDKLTVILENKVQSFQIGSESAKGSHEESYLASTGKSWWQFWEDEYVRRYRTVNTVNASAISRSIKETRSSMENALNDEVKKYKIEWKDKLKKQIIIAMRGEVTADGIRKNDEFLNLVQSMKAIDIIVHRIQDPEFSFLDELPEEVSKTGTLQNSDGEAFFEAVLDYIQNFKETVNREIRDYVEDLVGELRKIDIAKNLTQRLEEEIEQRMQEIQTKEATLAKYQKILTELRSLQGKTNG